MILEFSIENYGCYGERQTLSFDASVIQDVLYAKERDIYDADDLFLKTSCSKIVQLFKTNILLGGNETGKSMLLYALSVLCDFVRQKYHRGYTIGCMAGNFIPYIHDKTKIATLEVKAIFEGKIYCYTLTFNDHDTLTENLKINGQKIKTITIKNPLINYLATKILFPGRENTCLMTRKLDEYYYNDRERIVKHYLAPYIDEEGILLVWDDGKVNADHAWLEQFIKRFARNGCEKSQLLVATSQITLLTEQDILLDQIWIAHSSERKGTRLYTMDSFYPRIDRAKENIINEFLRGRYGGFSYPKGF